LIVTHARSVIKTHGHHELVRRHRQGQQQDDTLRGSPASSRLNSLHHAHPRPLQGVWAITAMLLCLGSDHRLLDGLRSDLLLRLTKGRNSSV
jgi:hypothetical protein